MGIQDRVRMFLALWPMIKEQLKELTIAPEKEETD
jgi:hypothetical protein